MKYLIFVAVFISLFPILGYSSTIQQETIRICDDGAEWPPYTYFKREDGNRTDKIIGFSVDVIDRIFSPLNIKYTVSLPPWARCLEELKKGKTFSLALNASYSSERAKNYLLSASYYKTTNYYFYSQKSYPKGLIIQTKDEFNKFNICGLHGYNYATYGIKTAIDQQARNFSQLIDKLHRKRCDLFVDKFEILAGFLAIGENYLSDPNLRFAPIPEIESTPFYMLISKEISHAQELKQIIDDGLIRLEKGGEIKTLLEKYNLIRSDQR